MNQNLQDHLKAIVHQDQWMMHVLRIVRNLKLNDCWIGAGFIRNKVWDHLHDMSRTPLNDIDVVHFNSNDLTPESDKQLEEQLKQVSSELNWSVKNQARMHLKNGHLPYSDVCHALSFWPETATAIAVQLNDKDELEIIAPYGLEDLFHLIVTPTPNFNPSIFKQRIEQKNWLSIWNKLKVKS